jgi:hypothetical protein
MRHHLRVPTIRFGSSVLGANCRSPAIPLWVRAMHGSKREVCRAVTSSFKNAEQGWSASSGATRDASPSLLRLAFGPDR